MINGSSTTIAIADVVLSPADVATYTLSYTIDQDGDMNSGRLSNMASGADCPDGVAQKTAQRSNRHSSRERVGSSTSHDTNQISDLK